MTKEVTKAAGTAVADLGFDMEADAKVHQQDFSADMLTIPRLKILQDLSPEIKPGKIEYVEGARPGLLFNELTKTLDEEIEFYPAVFFERYIAWRPRKSGGGLVDPNLTKEQVEENFTQENIGRWIGMYRAPGMDEAERVEVQQTPEWIGFARSKSFGIMPVAISFPSTKVKSVRDINTTIHLRKQPTKDGTGTFTPPPFYHAFRMRTGLEQGNENEWFGFAIDHIGVLPDPGVDPMLVKEARALKLKYDTGKVKVDDAGLQQ